VGETVSGPEPVPVKGTVCGLFGPSAAKVSAPKRLPRAVGENVTPTKHDALAATLAPQVLLAIAKSPVTVMLLNVTVALVGFWTVTTFASPAPWTGTNPQVKLGGESVIGVVSADDNATHGSTMVSSVRRLSMGIGLRLKVTPPWHELLTNVNWIHCWNPGLAGDLLGLELAIEGFEDPVLEDVAIARLYFAED
jgi:hypothetical protein